jgi:hypothetical protein
MRLFGAAIDSVMMIANVHSAADEDAFADLDSFDARNMHSL